MQENILFLNQLTHFNNELKVEKRTIKFGIKIKQNAQLPRAFKWDFP